jgi:electron transfer flavoprotein beta subunit
MKICVCIKQVPGTTKVEMDEETGVMKRDGIEGKMNPYDLYALETALKMKATKGAHVTVLTMGPPQAAAVVHEAYMMGADAGVLLSDRQFAGADVLATAYTLSQGIRKAGPFDLILCGKQTTDGDTAQVGPEMAEFLDIPHVTNVLRILKLEKESMVVDMDLPNAIQTAEISYPCLLTVEKGINQPRLPSFRLKLVTRDRAVHVLNMGDLADPDETRYGLTGSPTQVVRIFPPEIDREKIVWTGSGDELADRVYDRLVEEKFV